LKENDHASPEKNPAAEGEAGEKDDVAEESGSKDKP